MYVMLLFTCVDSETSSSPYAVFGDTSTRDFWYRLIKELRASLQLVISKIYMSIPLSVCLLDTVFIIWHAFLR